LTEDRKDLCIVVSRVPYQENDLVLGLLTRTGGLVSVVARSARSSRRRFQGVLDLFVAFDAGFSRGRGGLPVLTMAEPVRFFPGILENLDLLEVGQSMIQAVRDLLRDAPSSPALFDNVLLAFEYLEKAEPSLAHLVLLDLVLSISAELGQVPEDGVCPGCGRISTRFAVSTDGQVLCVEHCLPGPVPAIPFPEGCAARKPMSDNPASGPAPWQPDRERSMELVSALVSGITGFPGHAGR